MIMRVITIRNDNKRHNGKSKETGVMDYNQVKIKQCWCDRVAPVTVNT